MRIISWNGERGEGEGETGGRGSTVTWGPLSARCSWEEGNETHSHVLGRQKGTENEEAKQGRGQYFHIRAHLFLAPKFCASITFHFA